MLKNKSCNDHKIMLEVTTNALGLPKWLINENLFCKYVLDPQEAESRKIVTPFRSPERERESDTYMPIQSRRWSTGLVGDLIVYP